MRTIIASEHRHPPKVDGGLLSVSPIGKYFGEKDMVLRIPTKLGRGGDQHAEKIFSRARGC